MNEAVKKQLSEVCLIGTGSTCCKYIIAGDEGLECGKISPFKSIIDEDWFKHKHIAQGDNCEGVDFKKL